MTTATTVVLDRPPADGQARPGRRRRRLGANPALTGVALIVAGATLAPLGFLILQAAQVGWSPVSSLLFRGETAQLLWNTIRLTIAVTALCALVGVAAAWCTERTDLPGRRWWAVLVVVPVAIPDFVISFGWVSLTSAVRDYWGAVLVMTLALYPLVYLPVVAALRGADPGAEEVARSLGLGRMATFRRVTLRQARPALLGGCLLVALQILAEYGAFEMLGYRTFTTEIFTQFHSGSIAAACALSLVLVALGLLVLVGDATARGKGRLSRVGGQAPRLHTRVRLGRATAPALAGFATLAVLALGVPVGMIVYWMAYGGRSTLPPGSIASAAGYTALYGLAAATVATLAAVPVAVVAVRRPGRMTMLLERSTFLIQALPGVVVALALVYVTVRYVIGIYETPEMLVLAYAAMFFPFALVAVRASVAQTSAQLEEVGRSLGRRPLSVLVRVTLPLVAPGLAAAFCLVFLYCVTELTATLVLIPTGQSTLATGFWANQTNLAYSQAAPYAALMIAIAVVPSYLLGRWFDRLPARVAPTAGANP